MGQQPTPSLTEYLPVLGFSLALPSLNFPVPFQITDDEIISTFDHLEAEHGRKLVAFYQLRSLFAPLVEGLVLLDRLVFLLEQVSSKNESSIRFWLICFIVR